MDENKYCDEKGSTASEACLLIKKTSIKPAKTYLTCQNNMQPIKKRKKKKHKILIVTNVCHLGMSTIGFVNNDRIKVLVNYSFNSIMLIPNMTVFELRYSI